jgi:hypothetical protein
MIIKMLRFASPATTMHHGTSTLSFLFVALVEMSHQTIVNRNEEQSVRFFRGRGAWLCWGAKFTAVPFCTRFLLRASIGAQLAAAIATTAVSSSGLSVLWSPVRSHVPSVSPTSFPTSGQSASRLSMLQCREAPCLPQSK